MTALGTPQRKRNRHASGLSRFERDVVCLVAFVLAAFNGRPFRLSSGFVCLLAAAILLTRGALKYRSSIVLPMQSRPIALLWAGWALVATVSTLVNFDLEAVNNLLWGYWVPFLLFLALAGLKPNRDDFQWLFGFFAFGLLLRFGYGALVFYSEWGIPSLSDLLFARYDLVRMTTYRDATFGNAGNSASIITIALPVLVWSLIMLPSMKRIARIVVVASIVILCLNVLITGAKSALIIGATMLLVSAFKLKTRWRYALLLFLGLATYLFTEYAGEPAMVGLRTVVTADAQENNSVAERVNSMKIGLKVMFDHPLGVGPGMTRPFNVYDVSHQFAVQQGSELGILGMIIVLLLAGLVVAAVFALKLSRHVDEAYPEVAFRFGAFSWIVYAMTANIPVNSGPTIPWIGMLAMFLAFSENRVYDKRFSDTQSGALLLSRDNGRDRR